MKISNLYKIGSEVVYYSTSLNTNRQTTYQALLNGEVVGIDTDGEVMSAEDASNDFLLMADYAPAGVLTPLSQIERNMDVGKFIIIAVRSAIVENPDGVSTLQKLSSIVLAVQIGMLHTASMMIEAVEPDDVLTVDRLTRWKEMLVSADAIEG